MEKVIAGIGLLLFASIVWAQRSPGSANKEVTPEALRAKIEALKPAKHVFREIVWKTCLLEALKEARQNNKPVLIWVLGGNPRDEGRC